MAEEEKMKIFVIILGILSTLIIFGLLVFSFIFESDCQQPKEWDKDKKVKSKDNFSKNDENRN